MAMNNMAVYPGKPMMDTDGKPIHAHAGGLFYENGMYYWYGVDGTFISG